jgi:hypothetical protein
MGLFVLSREFQAGQRSSIITRGPGRQHVPSFLLWSFYLLLCLFRFIYVVSEAGCFTFRPGSPTAYSKVCPVEAPCVLLGASYVYCGSNYSDILMDRVAKRPEIIQRASIYLKFLGQSSHLSNQILLS